MTDKMTARVLKVIDVKGQAMAAFDQSDAYFSLSPKAEVLARQALLDGKPVRFAYDLRLRIEDIEILE